MIFQYFQEINLIDLLLNLLGRHSMPSGDRRIWVRHCYTSYAIYN